MIVSAKSVVQYDVGVCVCVCALTLVLHLNGSCETIYIQ